MMYVITATWDTPDEVPIHAFEGPNDVEALTRLLNEQEEMIAKARRFSYGGRPWAINLWNVTADPFCVRRLDVYVEPS